MDSRVVLISGGARGIGRGVGKALAGDGHQVVITARNSAEAEDAASEISGAVDGSVRGDQLEITDPESVAALVKGIAEQEGRLDSVVNNAGVVGGYEVAAADVDVDAVRSVWEINTLGALSLTQAALPLLRQSACPRIVNVSSGMGQLDQMGGGSISYRLSKAAMNALTKVLANEEAGNGILVNSMCPGWVKTDLGGENAPRSIEEGADTAVWLATLGDDGPTGGFFRDRESIAW